MTTAELENLARIGRLKREPGVQAEFNGLVDSGKSRLADALTTSLSWDGRFDLAYNAGHALALAALRWHGYRPDSRYMVFQVLPHTLGLGADVWRVLDKAHTLRNKAEYDGLLERDEQLLSALVKAVREVCEAVVALAPLPR